MSLQEAFDKMEESCVPNNSFSVNWSSKGTGFGQFYFHTKDGIIFCDNELMSKEFIKKMLCQMVDDCTLTCESDCRDAKRHETKEHV